MRLDDAMTETCEHENFEAMVSVDRVQNGEDGPVENFIADIVINCAECGQKFEFMGVPPGLFWTSPATNMDGCELRAPIRPWGGTIAMGATFQMPPK